MKDLVVNPHTEVVDILGDGGGYTLASPRRGLGLRTATILRSEKPELCELFLDLSETRLDMIDVNLDLTDDDRSFLYENGVLVDADKVPDRALYACLLDEVEPSPINYEIGSLIIDPSFRYEPMDFANLAGRLAGEHLSGKPSAWVSEEVTAIDRGYWFTGASSEIISKFEAGNPLPAGIEPGLLGKMIGAGIVTTEDAVEKRTAALSAKLAVAHKRYAADKYVVIEDLLPKEQMAAMRRYFRQYVSNGFMPFEDGQAVRYYQHNEPLATVFHKQLTKLMSQVVGEEVIPSYVYAASYVGDSDLKPHCDREQCEFSISFQVDYLPEQPEHRSPWGLFLWKPEFGNDEPIEYSSDEFPAASEAEDTNPAVYLKSGDGLIYKGRELIHYRYPLPAGHQSTSLFFHYVSKDFEGALR